MDETLTIESDVHYWKHGSIGEYIVKSPMILGHESSGEVVECAKDCVQRKAGDRVAIEPGTPCRHCAYCREGMYNLCKEMSFAATPPINGTLQKYYVVPEGQSAALFRIELICRLCEANS